MYFCIGGENIDDDEFDNSIKFLNFPYHTIFIYNLFFFLYNLLKLLEYFKILF